VEQQPLPQIPEPSGGGAQNPDQNTSEAGGMRVNQTPCLSTANDHTIGRTVRATCLQIKLPLAALLAAWLLLLHCLLAVVLP
jgi:hypothetical protein